MDLDVRYRCITFTTTVWMVIRVHNRTTDSRANTHVTLTSCFTDIYKVVISVTDNTNGCAAVQTEPFSSRRMEV